MARKIIKACVDKWIPSGKEMAIVSEVQWKNGQTIRVRFLNGHQIQKKVQEIAKEWEKYANLKLDFGSDKDAEIRVSFKRLNEEGRPDTSSWSGTCTDGSESYRTRRYSQRQSYYELWGG